MREEEEGERVVGRRKEGGEGVQSRRYRCRVWRYPFSDTFAFVARPLNLIDPSMAFLLPCNVARHAIPVPPSVLYRPPAIGHCTAH
jgi:hypothetical protein